MESSMGIEFNLTREVPQGKPNIAVLRLSGWLDAQSEEGAEYVLLDMSGVDTITSAGIRGIQKSFGIMTPKGETVSRRLKLCNAAPQIYEVLSITGVLLSAPMYESPDIAIDSFGK
jgi:anti-anti-sigma regulatory factor